MEEALPMAAAWYPGCTVRVAGFYSAFISEQALTDIAMYERFLGIDIKREGGGGSRTLIPPYPTTI